MMVHFCTYAWNTTNSLSCFPIAQRYTHHTIASKSFPSLGLNPWSIQCQTSLHLPIARASLIILFSSCEGSWAVHLRFWLPMPKSRAECRHHWFGRRRTTAHGWQHCNWRRMMTTRCTVCAQACWWTHCDTRGWISIERYIPDIVKQQNNIIISVPFTIIDADE